MFVSMTLFIVNINRKIRNKVYNIIICSLFLYDFFITVYVYSVNSLEFFPAYILVTGNSNSEEGNLCIDRFQILSVMPQGIYKRFCKRQTYIYKKKTWHFLVKGIRYQVRNQVSSFSHQMFRRPFRFIKSYTQVNDVIIYESWHEKEPGSL